MVLGSCLERELEKHPWFADISPSRHRPWYGRGREGTFTRRRIRRVGDLNSSRVTRYSKATTFALSQREEAEKTCLERHWDNQRRVFNALQGDSGYPRVKKGDSRQHAVTPITERVQGWVASTSLGDRWNKRGAHNFARTQRRNYRGYGSDNRWTQSFSAVSFTYHRNTGRGTSYSKEA